MAEPSTDSLVEIDTERPPLKKIPVSKRVDYLKGSVNLSTTIFFKLECENWEEFIQLLEPIHRFDFVGKSPTIPITVNYKSIERERFEVVFTALSGLTYPTIIIHHIKKSIIDFDIVKKRKQFLEDCGYIVIKGKLSFANIKGEDD